MAWRSTNWNDPGATPMTSSGARASDLLDGSVVIGQLAITSNLHAS